LCDGVTKMEVKGLEPGQAMSHEQALAVTRSLMAEWARKHPDQHWEMAQGAGGGESTDEVNSPPASTDTPKPSPEPTTPPAEKPSPAPTAAHTASPVPSGNPILSGPGRKQMPIQQGDTYASF